MPYTCTARFVQFSLRMWPATKTVPVSTVGSPSVKPSAPPRPQNPFCFPVQFRAVCRCLGCSSCRWLVVEKVLVIIHNAKPTFSLSVTSSGCECIGKTPRRATFSRVPDNGFSVFLYCCELAAVRDSFFKLEFSTSAGKFVVSLNRLPRAKSAAGYVTGRVPAPVPSN